MIAGFVRVRAVALNTLREAVRNKVFVTLFVFGGLLVASSLLFGELSLHNETRVTRDVTLFASMVFSMIIAVHTSVTLFHTEIERRTIYTILSKPTPRWQFLVGKLLGVLGMMGGVVGFLGGLSVGAMLWQGDTWSGQMPLAFAGLYCQVVIVTALAHMLSTVASPLLAGFSTVALCVAGNLMTQLELIKKIMEERSPFLLPLLEGLKWVLPNLEALNLSYELTYRVPIPASYVLQAGIYTLGYSVVVMTLACGLFHRKDLM